MEYWIIEVICWHFWRLNNTCQPPATLCRKYIIFIRESLYQKEQWVCDDIVMVSKRSVSHWAGELRTILLDNTNIRDNDNNIEVKNMQHSNISASSFAGRYRSELSGYPANAWGSLSLYNPPWTTKVYVRTLAMITSDISQSTLFFQARLLDGGPRIPKVIV